MAGVAGYYPSYYDNSVYASDSRISFDYGIPRCGSVPTTFTPPSNGTVVPPGPSTLSAPIALLTAANLRPGPSEGSGAALAVMPAGTSPGFLCWTTGEVVNNVDVWFKVHWGGATGYYASGLDNSSYRSDLEITGKYGIPYCGGGNGPAPPTSTTPASTTPPAAAGGPEVKVPAGGPAKVHVCPSEVCEEAQYPDGSIIEWPDGHPVEMLCWVDSTLIGGQVTEDGPKSPRWFAVYAYQGTYEPVYAWIFSNNVADQAHVPNCNDPAFQADNQWMEILTGGLTTPGECPNQQPCGHSRVLASADSKWRDQTRPLMIAPDKPAPAGYRPGPGATATSIGLGAGHPVWPRRPLG